MAEIRPFEGYRFRLDSPEKLGSLVSPPYDMVDSAKIEELYNRHPHNAVRIIQNKPADADLGNKDRHIRASELFVAWFKEGVLVRDEQPSVYIYEQKFNVDKMGTSVPVQRIGVVVATKLTEFSEGVVFPHEYTLSGPKKDRYELLETTRINTGQIFGLVPDEGDFYESLRACRNKGELVGTFVDEHQVRHSLYYSNDPEMIERLVSLVAPRTILIADGHHRYETALKFYNDSRNPDYGYTMMTLVSMADPGLVIRPFHRLIFKTQADNHLHLLDELRPYCSIKEGTPASVEAIHDFMSKKDSDDLLYFNSATGQIHELELTEGGEKYLANALPEHSPLWCQLNVSKINALVIGAVLELPLDGSVLHDHLEFCNDVEAVLQKLRDAQNYHGGFFIRSLSIETIHDIVAGGERMPQKSTNFFPKFYSGLVFNKLDRK